MLGELQMAILVIVIDIAVLIISIILIKKYLTQKIMFPKTRLIKGSGMTNDDLDINNSIFLHMTDGIIAFDRDGKLILINPAAQKLLNVQSEHQDFKDIFGRFHLDVNLENETVWLSLEQMSKLFGRIFRKMIHFYNLAGFLPIFGIS